MQTAVAQLVCKVGVEIGHSTEDSPEIQGIKSRGLEEETCTPANEPGQKCLQMEMEEMEEETGIKSLYDF